MSSEKEGRQKNSHVNHEWCQADGKGDCMNEGMRYRIDSITCKEERGITVRYYGESTRTLYDRGGDHWRAWRTGQKDSVLTIHVEEEHLGEGCQYQMNAVSSHRLPLVRQAQEAVLISRFEGKENGGAVSHRS